jgi:hypothetical protein
VASVPARIARRAGGAVEIVQAETEHGYSLEVACRIDITDPLPPETLVSFANQNSVDLRSIEDNSSRGHSAINLVDETDFKI